MNISSPYKNGHVHKMKEKTYISELRESEKVKLGKILKCLLEEENWTSLRRIANSTHLRRTSVMRIVNKTKDSGLFYEREGKRKARLCLINIKGFLLLISRKKIGPERAAKCLLEYASKQAEQNPIPDILYLEDKKMEEILNEVLKGFFRLIGRNSSMLRKIINDATASALVKVEREEDLEYPWDSFKQLGVWVKFFLSLIAILPAKISGIPDSTKGSIMESLIKCVPQERHKDLKELVEKISKEKYLNFPLELVFRLFSLSFSE
jgi:hypothetical protein